MGFKTAATWLMAGAACLAGAASLAATPGEFSLEQALSYPYVSEVAAAQTGARIAWVRNLEGVRNIWVADGPAFTPREVTHYTADDGQELTQLTFSPDGQTLLFVRGGDHDENWPAEGRLEPDPDSSTETPVVAIWSASLSGGAPVKVAEGDAPAISADGRLAFLKDGQVWTAPLAGVGADGKVKAERLFFDRGHDEQLAWSPDGSRLAFVSARGDHGFIGVYAAKDKPLIYLAPSTDLVDSPRWSPDGSRIAFVRAPGDGGAPRPMSVETFEPWSIWVADAAGGEAHAVWRSPNLEGGSYPDTQGQVNLTWAAGDRLVFLAELDNWPHLYSVSAAGGDAMLLTPGAYMVEHVTVSRDRRFMIYDANTGSTRDDDDRRHLFRVAVDAAAPTALTSGEGVQWAPVVADDADVAFISAGAQAPTGVGVVKLMGGEPKELSSPSLADAFPAHDLIAPRSVSWAAPDGVVVHGQLFQRPGGGAVKPGLIFVHGGPPRQMLLGWHYMDYYSHAYALNQYLAAHGYVVLSVNYRLGVGYGRAFQHPAKAGPRGASEYQDVLAGARYLQSLPGVDAKRIGIWGGSYGGYLTALGLARNSEVFKAGVDLHGVHDWPDDYLKRLDDPDHRYEKGDRAAASDLAWSSSPVADLSGWKSPVLLIQGDDDRNVDFHQTVDLARRLDALHVAYEELVLPNEIHGFLRHASWLRADRATIDFLNRIFFGTP